MRAVCTAGVAVICFASSAGCSGALVMKDQTEVCPLSHGVMFREGNPYPNDYWSAFASSVLLYPQCYRHSLRHAFPDGSTSH
jgi:hypothetical protein